MKKDIPSKNLSIQRLNKSFIYALNGIKILIKEEQNYLVHIVFGIMAVILGFVFKISALEWIAIILAIQTVLLLETINTAFENLSDFVSTQVNNKIKRIKDLAAAGVLIAAIGSVIIGLIIFLPKFLAVLS